MHRVVLATSCGVLRALAGMITLGLLGGDPFFVLSVVLSALPGGAVFGASVYPSIGQKEEYGHADHHGYQKGVTEGGDALVVQDFSEGEEVDHYRDPYDYKFSSSQRYGELGGWSEVLNVGPVYWALD